MLISYVYLISLSFLDFRLHRDFLHALSITFSLSTSKIGMSERVSRFVDRIALAKDRSTPFHAVFKRLLSRTLQKVLLFISNIVGDKANTSEP